MGHKATQIDNMARAITSIIYITTHKTKLHHEYI